MYLKGEKNTEVRKSAPKPKSRLDKEIAKVPFIIKTKGSNSGYIRAKVSHVRRSGDKDNLWNENKEKVKFGITKSRYDDYYSSGNNSEAVLIIFENIQIINPPVEGLPGTQTYRYVDIDEEYYDFEDLSSSYTQELIEKTNEIQRRLEEK
jgi:hypothetical protein